MASKVQDYTSPDSLALGSRPAAGVARRLMPPASRDPLLRVARRRARHLPERPTVIGIDAWAYKRGQRYGTIVYDLERRRVVTLLPDREGSTVESWLRARSKIAIIARDRGGVTVRPLRVLCQWPSRSPTAGI